MNILIAGASGFIGHALVRSLKIDHHITVLGRNKSTLQREFSNAATCCTWDELSQLDAKQFDAIINLCGFNIAASKWSEAVKKQLIDSRVSTSTILIHWLIKHQAKPHFICANAVGIYGLQDNGDQSAFDEDTLINTKNPPDFLSKIGVCWQEALQPAIDYGIPVTTTRFGVVLQKGQGMLKKLFPSFYLGLGAIIGDGQQSLSWVHINDVVGAITFLLNKPELTGAFNLTSPYPVSQKEFSHKLATCLHRPLFLKMPAFFIRLLFGEMGECLLLKGQRVVPKRLFEAGYQFQYPKLNQALQREFSNR
ncbi:MAG: TIGR01777 family oxidoreductase [Legionellaceae bacterium]|nr:TIGR01777 family oxidoreductase [Legionellaceae bacterium]